MIYTTFRILWEKKMYKRDYKRLSRKLGGVNKYGRDKPISFTAIIMNLCEIDVALWVLSACKNAETLCNTIIHDFMVHASETDGRIIPEQDWPKRPYDATTYCAYRVAKFHAAKVDDSWNKAWTTETMWQEKHFRKLLEKEVKNNHDYTL